MMKRKRSCSRKATEKNANSSNNENLEKEYKIEGVSKVSSKININKKFKKKKSKEIQINKISEKEENILCQNLAEKKNEENIDNLRNDVEQENTHDLEKYVKEKGRENIREKIVETDTNTDTNTDIDAFINSNNYMNSYDNFLGAPHSWECLEKNSGWYLIKTVNNFELYFNVLTNKRYWHCPKELENILHQKKKEKKETEREKEIEKEKEKNNNHKEIEMEIETYSGYSDYSGSIEENDKNGNKRILAILHNFKNMLIEKKIKQFDAYEDILPLIQYDIRFLSVPNVVRKQCFYLLLNKIYNVKVNEKKKEFYPQKKSMFTLIEDLKKLLQRAKMNLWCHCNENDFHLTLKDEKEYIGDNTESWNKIRELLIKEYAQKLLKRKEAVEKGLNGVFIESEYLTNPQKLMRFKNIDEPEKLYKIIYIKECVDLFKKKAEEICTLAEKLKKKRKETFPKNSYNMSYQNALGKCEKQEKRRERKGVRTKLEQNIDQKIKSLSKNTLLGKEIKKGKNEKIENDKSEEKKKNKQEEVKMCKIDEMKKSKKRKTIEHKENIVDNEADTFKERQRQNGREVMEENDKETRTNTIIRKENEMEKDVVVLKGIQKYNGNDQKESGNIQIYNGDNGKDNGVSNRKDIEKEVEMGTKKKENKKRENKKGIKEESENYEEQFINKEQYKELLKCKDTNEWLKQKLQTKEMKTNEIQTNEIKTNEMETSETKTNEQHKIKNRNSETNDGTKMLFLLFAHVEIPVVNEVLLKSGNYVEKECFDKVFNIPDSILNNQIYKTLSLSDNEKFQVYKHFVIGFTKTKLNIFTERIKALPIEYINQSLNEILKKIDKTGKEFSFLNYKCMHNTYLDWKREHIKILKIQFQEYLNGYDFTQYNFNINGTYDTIMEHMSVEKSFQLLQCVSRERDEMINRQIEMFKQRQASAVTQVENTAAV